MGKTSLLNYISHPDVIQSHGLDPATYPFVYLDLQMVGADGTPARLYQYLLRRLQGKVQDPELQERIREVMALERLDTFDLSDLFDAIDERGLRIVLLLDEFENIGTNTYFGPEFYYGLRSLAIHHNLALVTASHRDLVELSHSDAVRSSPFFNIFTTIHRRSFSAAETQALLQEALKEREVSFNADEARLVMELAGGNPFLLQMGAYILFAAYQDGRTEAQRRERLGLAFADEVHPHLIQYWESTPSEEKTLLMLLALLEAREEPGVPGWSLSHLEQWCRRSGVLAPALVRPSLATETEKGHRLFSPAFTRVILEELTTPPPMEAHSAEEPEQMEAALSALARPVRSRVASWVGGAITQHRDLFLAWMSDPATAEAALELVPGPGGLFSTAEGSGDRSQTPSTAPPAQEPPLVPAEGWEDLELVVTLGPILPSFCPCPSGCPGPPAARWRR